MNQEKALPEEYLCKCGNYFDGYNCMNCGYLEGDDSNKVGIKDCKYHATEAVADALAPRMLQEIVLDNREKFILTNAKTQDGYLQIEFFFAGGYYRLDADPESSNKLIGAIKTKIGDKYKAEPLTGKTTITSIVLFVNTICRNPEEYGIDNLKVFRKTQ